MCEVVFSNGGGGEWSAVSNTAAAPLRVNLIIVFITSFESSICSAYLQRKANGHSWGIFWRSLKKKG